MGRRRNAGLVEGLLELSRTIPWWATLAIAIISYLLLHAVSGMEVHAGEDPGALGGWIVRQLVVTLASVLQYIVPGVLCLGALIAALIRWRGEQLHAHAMAGDQAVVAGMDWADFEQLIAAVFRRRGMHVTRLGGNGPDGGVDLVATQANERFLIQCKQWRARTVGVAVARELYGVMAAQGATGGFVVTSGHFSRDAQEFASGRNIHLIDGTRLQRLFKQLPPPTRRSPDMRHATSPHPTPVPPEPDPEAPQAHSVYSAIVAPPKCPRCGALMVKRLARVGSHAGEPFWGCARFPKCRSILPVSTPALAPRDRNEPPRESLP